MSELTQITPRQCEVGVCTNVAHYESNGTAVCEEELVHMSWMNEDNKDFFEKALETLAALAAK